MEQSPGEKFKKTIDDDVLREAGDRDHKRRIHGKPTDYSAAIMGLGKLGFGAALAAMNNPLIKRVYLLKDEYMPEEQFNRRANMLEGEFAPAKGFTGVIERNAFNKRSLEKIKDSDILVMGIGAPPFDSMPRETMGPRAVKCREVLEKLAEEGMLDRKMDYRIINFLPTVLDPLITCSEMIQGFEGHIMSGTNPSDITEKIIALYSKTRANRHSGFCNIDPMRAEGVLFPELLWELTGGIPGLRAGNVECAGDHGGGASVLLNLATFSGVSLDRLLVDTRVGRQIEVDKIREWLNKRLEMYAPEMKTDLAKAAIRTVLGSISRYHDDPEFKARIDEIKGKLLGGSQEEYIQRMLGDINLKDDYFIRLEVEPAFDELFRAITLGHHKRDPPMVGASPFGKIDDFLRGCHENYLVGSRQYQELVEKDEGLYDGFPTHYLLERGIPIAIPAPVPLCDKGAMDFFRSYLKLHRIFEGLREQGLIEGYIEIPEPLPDPERDVIVERVHVPVRSSAPIQMMPANLDELIGIKVKEAARGKIAETITGGVIIFGGEATINYSPEASPSVAEVQKADEPSPKEPEKISRLELPDNLEAKLYALDKSEGSNSIAELDFQSNEVKHFSFNFGPDASRPGFIYFAADSKNVYAVYNVTPKREGEPGKTEFGLVIWDKNNQQVKRQVHFGRKIPLSLCALDGKVYVSFTGSKKVIRKIFDSEEYKKEEIQYQCDQVPGISDVVIGKNLGCLSLFGVYSQDIYTWEENKPRHPGRTTATGKELSSLHFFNKRRNILSCTYREKTNEDDSVMFYDVDNKWASHSYNSYLGIHDLKLLESGEVLLATAEDIGEGKVRPRVLKFKSINQFFKGNADKTLIDPTEVQGMDSDNVWDINFIGDYLVMHGMDNQVYSLDLRKESAQASEYPVNSPIDLSKTNIWRDEKC